MVDGIWDSAFSQGSITWSRKLSLTHSHSKISDEFDSVCSGHVLEKKVVSESDASVVLWVAVSHPSFIVKWVFTNCCLTGSRSRSKASHEAILFGSGTISKCCGSWEGQCERRIWVSLSFVMSLSRERASATLLSAPRNHRLYSDLVWSWVGHFAMLELHSKLL